MQETPSTEVSTQALDGPLPPAPATVPVRDLDALEPLPMLDGDFLAQALLLTPPQLEVRDQISEPDAMTRTAKVPVGFHATTGSMWVAVVDDDPTVNSTSARHPSYGLSDGHLLGLDVAAR